MGDNNHLHVALRQRDSLFYFDKMKITFSVLTLILGPNYLLHEVLWPILIVVLGAVLLLVIILYRRGLIKWPRRKFYFSILQRLRDGRPTCI